MTENLTLLGNESAHNNSVYPGGNVITTGTDLPGGDSNPAPSSHVLAYILVPLGSLVLVALLALTVVFIFRRSRIDKLRHHLMPLYSFDPGDDEQDWESELLEDQDGQPEKSPTSSTSPQLKFTASRR